MVSLFWERFYDACIEKGTKPNPVAKKIGVSSGVVTKWKNDGTLPNSDTILKIANHLECSVDYLLGKTDTKEKPLTENGQELDEEEQRIYNMIISLSPEKRKLAEQYLDALANLSAEKDKS